MVVTRPHTKSQSPKKVHAQDTRHTYAAPQLKHHGTREFTHSLARSLISRGARSAAHTVRCVTLWGRAALLKRSTAVQVGFQVGFYPLVLRRSVPGPVTSQPTRTSSSQKDAIQGPFNPGLLRHYKRATLEDLGISEWTVQSTDIDATRMGAKTGTCVGPTVPSSISFLSLSYLFVCPSHTLDPLSLRPYRVTCTRGRFWKCRRRVRHFHWSEFKTQCCRQVQHMLETHHFPGLSEGLPAQRTFIRFSTLNDGITGVTIVGKRASVCGCGNDCASALRGSSARVFVAGCAFGVSDRVINRRICRTGRDKNGVLRISPSPRFPESCGDLA